MYALERRKREWEYQNQQRWLKLVAVTGVTAKESVDRAGIVISFLLYIILKAASWMGAWGRLLWHGHRPVVRTGPWQTEELHEQYRTLHEAQPLNPFLRR